MKFVNYKFGKMISAVDRSTGKEYNDWRTKYLNWPGLIVVKESEHRSPGEQLVYLYPSDINNPVQPYFHSSLGSIEQTDDRMICTTKRSIYTFLIGDCGLSAVEQDELMHVVIWSE